MKWFVKKAAWIDVEVLRGTIANHSEDLRKHYDALKSQKKMLDMVMDYLNIEPVTTTIVTGANYPEKKTELKLKKKQPRKKSTEDEGGDDD